MNRPPVRIFFILSLAMNIFLVGMILGNTWWHVTGHWEDITHDLKQNLPPEKQELFESALNNMKQDTDSVCQQISKSRDAIAKLLISDPFDRATYLIKAQSVRELRNKLLERRSIAIADLAARFIPAERSVLVDLIYRLPAPTCQKIH